MKKIEIVAAMMTIIFCGIVHGKQGTIYLKNGNNIDGDVRHISGNIVLVVFRNGSMEFSKKEIKKIVYRKSRPAYQSVYARDEQDKQSADPHICSIPASKWQRGRS